MCDKRRPDAAVLDRPEALAHRGPDGSGRHISGPVGLVSTRLAIIDLRTGDQPICDARGAVVVANGEIYNDLELRSQLGDQIVNHHFICIAARESILPKTSGACTQLRFMTRSHQI